MALTAEQLKRLVVPTRAVTCDGIGDVYVRGLTIKEIAEWQKADKEISAFDLLRRGLSDENGGRLFSDDEPIETLQALPAQLAEPALIEIAKLTGLKVPNAATTPLQDAEKKLEPAASSSSSSDSPGSSGEPSAS